MVFLLLRMQVIVDLTEDLLSKLIEEVSKQASNFCSLFYTSELKHNGTNESKHKLFIQPTDNSIFEIQGCLALVLQQNVLYNAQIKNIKTIFILKVNN